jgi:hypothetical protein
MPSFDSTQTENAGAIGRHGPDKSSTISPSTGKAAAQVRRQASRLLDQGMGKATQFAEAGKDQVATKLDDVASVLTIFAGSAREQYGDTAGGYIEAASRSVAAGAEGLRGRTIRGLVAESRIFLAKNAGAAIGTAAVAGFIAARIAKGGLQDDPARFAPEPYAAPVVVVNEGAIA